MDENFRSGFDIRETSYPCSQKSFLTLSIGLKQSGDDSAAAGNFSLQ
jgi:hypothetical protein